MKTKNTVNQSKLEVVRCGCRKARENTCERVTIGFGFISGWLKKCREFLSQSCGVENAKPISFRHSNENRSKKTSSEEYFFQAFSSIASFGLKIDLLCNSSLHNVSNCSHILIG